MDKQTLNQYRALVREIPKLKRDIEKLEERLDKVPTVAGKVTKSGDDFPYIVEHVKVEMEEPKVATEIKLQIRYKELRLNSAERQKTEIEKFIAGIEDSTDRQIFEMRFLEGKSQYDIGKLVGLERSSVSKRIDKYLQLSHNSHF